MNKKKCYSGEFGDFTLYSFNIMKNISSLYGGAVSTNEKNFTNYCLKENSKMNDFNLMILSKQMLIFLVLQLMSIKILYRYLFVYIIRYVHQNNIKSILQLFYPSLKSIKVKFPKYYFSKISNFSSQLTYFQLKDKNRRKRLFELRKKKNNYYLEKLSGIKNKQFNLIQIKDQNYQNFLDFPILVKNKKGLNNYLLKKGIEIRVKHYYNCQKMFGTKKKCINAERYEKELICFPAHIKTKNSYIDFIETKLRNYY